MPNSGVNYNQRPYTQRGSGQTVGLVTRKTAKHTNGKVEQKAWPQKKVMHTKRDRPNSGVITTTGRTHNEGAAKQWVWLQEKRPNIQTGRWNRRVGLNKRSCTQRETGRTVGLITTTGRTHKEGAAKQWFWSQGKKPCTQRGTGQTVGLVTREKDQTHKWEGEIEGLLNNKRS